MGSDKQFPEGWRNVAIKDIAAQLLNGGTPSTEVEEYWKGIIPWVTGADFEDQKLLLGRRHITQEAVRNSATNVVPKGQLLVLTRTGVGKVAEAPTDVAISQDITGLIVEEQQYDRRFIYWQLDRLIPQLGRLKQGTSINGILREDFERFELPVPKHRETQTRIAQIIDSVDNTIEATRVVIGQTRQLKTALLQDLLTNGLPGRHRKFRSTKYLTHVPADWQILPLERIGDGRRPALRTGPFGSSLKTAHFTTSGRPVLTIGSLGEGEILRGELFYVGEAKAMELSEYEVEPGDVVFSRVADVGRSVTIPEWASGWIISSNLMRIAVDKSRFDPWFLRQLLVHSQHLKK